MGNCSEKCLKRSGEASFFCLCQSGIELRPQNDLLYQPWIMNNDEYGVIGGMIDTKN
jgi:hypothetical protein